MTNKSGNEDSKVKMMDSPFGGSGGNAVPMDAATVSKKDELLNLLNTAGKQKYLIDPDGIKMEISFEASGICTIKSGETLLTFAYKKI